MTIEEAIEQLKQTLKQYMRGGDEEFDKQRRKAIIGAFEALCTAQELAKLDRSRWEGCDMIEVWKPVNGYEGRYIVSNFGNIMSIPHSYTGSDGKHYSIDGKTLGKHKDPKGYIRVSLGKRNTKKLHRIVAEAFIPNPLLLPEVNHIDGNKENNRSDNLEWVTHEGNVKHAVEAGLFGDRAKKATPEIVEAIRSEYVPYDRSHSTEALAKKYGLSPSYVWRIVKMKKRNGKDILAEEARAKLEGRIGGNNDN